MRHNSDVDVLIDFPDDRADDAWTFLENLVREFGVPIDMHDKRRCSVRFVDHIRAIPVT
jgi:predicted nucleotidyltransferase